MYSIPLGIRLMSPSSWNKRYIPTLLSRLPSRKLDITKTRLQSNPYEQHPARIQSPDKTKRRKQKTKYYLNLTISSKDCTMTFIITLKELCWYSPPTLKTHIKSIYSEPNLADVHSRKYAFSFFLFGVLPIPSSTHQIYL